jgi:hypothetical protein
MRIIHISAAIIVLCAACAQNPAPETTAAIVTPTPTVAVVEKPVVVEKKVIVAKPVVVTKTVIVEKKVYVAKPAVKVSGSRCHYVRPYTRKSGVKVSGHTRCRK